MCVHLQDAVVTSAVPPQVQQVGIQLLPDLSSIGCLLSAMQDDRRTHLLDAVPKDEVDYGTLSIRQLVYFLQQTGFVQSSEGAASAKGITANDAAAAVHSACFPDSCPGAEAQVCIFSCQCSPPAGWHSSFKPGLATLQTWYSEHTSVLGKKACLSTICNKHCDVCSTHISRFCIWLYKATKQRIPLTCYLHTALQHTHGQVQEGAQAAEAPSTGSGAVLPGAAFFMDTELTYVEFVKACAGMAQLIIAKDDTLLAKVCYL